MRRLYSVCAGSSWVIVEADTTSEAKRDVLERLGFEHKPYLLANMAAHVATDEDIRRYAHLADAHRKYDQVKETARKRPRKGAKNTLLPEGGAA